MKETPKPLFFQRFIATKRKSGLAPKYVLIVQDVGIVNMNYTLADARPLDLTKVSNMQKAKRLPKRHDFDHRLV